MGGGGDFDTVVRPYALAAQAAAFFVARAARPWRSYSAGLAEHRPRPQTCAILKNSIACSGMIRSFRCRDTERLAADLSARRFVAIERIARRKLEILASVSRLEELRVPPGNRLEALKGNRVGQYSIRVNDQWRICFRWQDGDAYDVEIVDYH